MEGDSQIDRANNKRNNSTKLHTSTECQSQSRQQTEHPRGTTHSQRKNAKLARDPASKKAGTQAGPVDKLTNPAAQRSPAAHAVVPVFSICGVWCPSFLSVRWCKFFYSTTAKCLRETLPMLETTLADHMEARSMEKTNRFGKSFLPSDKLPEQLEMASALKALTIVCVLR